jgi:hypothetical protein
MKHKVAELGGALLDAAVAKAERDPSISMCEVPWIDGGTTAGHGMTGRAYSPSTDWSQGGPIIERERITVGWIEFGAPHWPGQWYAQYSADNNHHHTADNPLTAAMRAYVASKCGDEVELP